MLVTFTNRAAREMLNRVELLVKQQTRHIGGGTFHHIANRILRQYGPKIGIANDFTILDREDASDLLKSCVPEAGIAIEKRRFPQKRVLMEISSFLQNTLEPLEQLLVRRYPMFLEECEQIVSRRMKRDVMKARAHRRTDDLCIPEIDGSRQCDCRIAPQCGRRPKNRPDIARILNSIENQDAQHFTALQFRKRMRRNLRDGEHTLRRLRLGRTAEL
jgi:hypothetical protein